MAADLCYIAQKSVLFFAPFCAPIHSLCKDCIFMRIIYENLLHFSWECAKVNHDKPYIYKYLYGNFLKG